MLRTSSAFRPTAIALLLAGSALGSAAHAAGTQTQAQAQADQGNAVAEVIVTAEKRSENVQNVAAVVDVLDSRALERLNVNGFEDYTKYLPNVTFQTLGPDTTSVYIRGVSSGDNANHSGPLPTVGVYLDEQPITTIGGTLDVHIYDIARVEVLAGSARHALRRELRSGHPAHHHQPAVDGGLPGGVRPAGRLRRPRRRGLCGRGLRQHPGHRQDRRAPGRLRRARPGYIDNVPGTRPFADVRQHRRTSRLRRQQHQQGRELRRSRRGSVRHQRQLEHHPDGDRPGPALAWRVRLRSLRRRPQGPAVRAGQLPRPVAADRLDDQRQDRPLRPHLQRRLLQPRRSTRSATTPTIPSPTTRPTAPGPTGRTRPERPCRIRSRRSSGGTASRRAATSCV